MSDGVRVDLLARRTARLEAEVKPPTFECGDHVYEGAPELPLVFVDFLRQGRFTDALRTIFGDQTDAFVAEVDPTLGDLMVIAEIYGASLPSSLTSTVS